MNKKQTMVATLLIFNVISLLPTFAGFLNWNQDYSNIGLFILMYFIAGIFEKVSLDNRRIPCFLSIWLICFVALVCSPYAIKIVKSRISIGKLEASYMYQYWNVLVIGEAVSLFALLKDIKISNDKLGRVLKTFAGATLITYELHMHPIFKTQYTPLKVFSYVDVSNSLEYIIEILLTCAAIWGIGVVVSIPVTKLSKKFVKFVIKKEKNEKIISEYFGLSKNDEM